MVHTAHKKQYLRAKIADEDHYAIINMNRMIYAMGTSRNCSVFLNDGTELDLEMSMAELWDWCEARQSDNA